MAGIVGRMIGPQILKALGLEGQCVRTIDIHIATKEAVTIKTESLIVNEQADGLVIVLGEYHLTPKRSIIDEFDQWFASAVERSGLASAPSGVQAGPRAATCVQ